MHRLLAGIVVVFAVQGQVRAAESGALDFSPGAFKLQRGQPNELMVLGSAHLSQLPKSFDPANLSLLMERLAAWQPKAIAIEALSGSQCAFLRSYPERYDDTVKSYCWDPAPAASATGLDVPAATAQVDRTLAAWPAAPMAGQRRKLASLFLAAGEPASATVQWLRLPADERHAGDGLNDKLVEILDKLRLKRGEDYLIAASLAARCGHERVYPMDDHTADSNEADEKAYGAAIMKAWDNPFNATRKLQDDALYAGLATPAGVLAMYRAFNAAGAAELTFRGDFGAALEEPSPQHFGRGYVSYWETRNLRMASNIREASGLVAGRRTLVVVGASHKGYLEAYLNQMHDVRVVSTDSILRAE
ncbi:MULTISPECIES: DUF5694 domain-containing protein [unclassified Duganella]|uniref:DUF5694 domain-containing protein n=1 Tax=unclassified Duganella TaxID=2636909 RepID=UPI000E3497F5|nr:MULTISPECIES: DUF5694 domain-containing protein [unclassified Duganella]RFP13584.1 hypothetical protein D0T23_14330 [Duganella sp. BJB475]RFP36292.1 hypothetical protein D0T21_07685 [Duganella sp. BJB476]